MMARKSLTPIIFSLCIIVSLYILMGFVAGYRLFPPITKVLNRFIELLADGTLIIHGGVSLIRVFWGMIFSLIVGIPAGILLGRIPILDRYFSPFFYFLYPIPKITFLPVILLLFGLGNLSKVAIIFIIVVFQVTITVRDSVKKLDSRLYHSIVAFGGGRISILRHGVIPAIMPDMFSSLRISSGTAMAVLFMAESFATERGMGYFIMDSWMRVSYTDMHCGIIMLSIIGLFIFWVLDVSEKKLCPWTIE